jgi:hypothetical protein
MNEIASDEVHTGKVHRFLPNERWLIMRLSGRSSGAAGASARSNAARELRNYGSAGADLLTAARADALTGGLLLIVVAIAGAAAHSFVVGIILLALLPLFALSWLRSWQASVAGREFRAGRPFERRVPLTGDANVDAIATRRGRSRTVSMVIAVVGIYLAIPGLVLAILGRHNHRELFAAALLSIAGVICGVTGLVLVRDLRRTEAGSQTPPPVPEADRAS